MNKRFLGLDVARALLAWSVVAIHCAYYGGIHNESWALGGIWAVAGFIVISGFVIGSLLLGKKERYQTFIFRRFMRLFPVYGVCLGIALLLRPLISNPLLDVAQMENDRFWALLVSHLAMLHGVWPHASIGECAFLPPAWSISLEWQLYLAAPFLLAAMLRYRLRFIVPFLAITIPIALLNIANVIKWNEGFILMRICFFGVGMVSALYLNRLPPALETIRWPRWLVWLGKISYSTYLIHWPILALLAHKLPRHWTGVERTLYLALAATPLIVLASFGLYELVEKPGINLGKIICNTLQQSRQRRDRLVNPVDL